MATTVRDLVPDYEDFRDNVVASFDENGTIHIGDLCNYPHEDSKLVSFEELVIMLAGKTESFCVDCTRQIASIHVSSRIAHA